MLEREKIAYWAIQDNTANIVYLFIKDAIMDLIGRDIEADCSIQKPKKIKIVSRTPVRMKESGSQDWTSCPVVALQGKW